MLKKKILAVGPLRTNFKSGVTIGFNFTLAILSKKFHLVKINTSKNVNNKNIRKFSLSRVIATVLLFINLVKNVRKVNYVYYIASLSYLGFIRDFFVIIICKIYNKKVFIHIHGGNFKKNLLKYPIFNFFVIYIYKKTDKVFVLSQKFIKDFNFLEKSKIFVLPNSIPSNLDIKEKFIKKKIKSHSKIKILYLSNLILSKGYLNLLEVCKMLKDKKIEFECIFAGNFISVKRNENIYELERNFKQILVKNKLKKNVSLIKNLSLKKKIHLLKRSNIFILPTKYPGEGLPISLIEATFFGLPIISTKNGAISDIVENNKNGYLINHNYPKHIYRKIIKLFKNKKKFESMSYNSRKIYDKKFSFKKIKIKTEKCFEIEK